MDGHKIIATIRLAGFQLSLDESDKPVITPIAKLTESQRALLRDNRDLIRLALLSERKPTDPLTGHETPPWETLSAWWLSWTPPSDPYEISPGVTVVDPAASYRYHADLLSLDCYGQVRIAMHAWMKRHYLKFASA